MHFFIHYLIYKATYLIRWKKQNEGKPRQPKMPFGEYL